MSRLARPQTVDVTTVFVHHNGRNLDDSSLHAKGTILRNGGEATQQKNPPR